MPLDYIQNLSPNNQTGQGVKHHYVLVGVVIVAIVIWCIVLYQNQMSNNIRENISVPLVQSNTNELTTEERNKAISELQSAIQSSPPVTETERAKAIQELQKAINSQKK